MAAKTIKPRGIYMWVTYDELVNITSSTSTDYTTALTNYNNTVSAKMNPADIAAAKQALMDAEKALNNDVEQSLNEVYDNKTSIPFILAGVQSADFQWTHTLGQVKGLSAAFLQPWYNEPVNITVNGLSYIGAWGGTTVDASIQAAIDKGNADAIAASGNKFDAIAGTQRVLNAPNVLAQSVTDYISQGVSSVMSYVTKLTSILNYAKQKPLTGPIQDNTISSLKNLISFLNHGPDGNFNKKYKNVKVTLLIENEPDSGGSSDNFASFEGYVTSFNYKEDVVTPYLYDWTFTFIGEPQTKTVLNGKQVEAKQAMIKFGVTNPGITGSSKTLFTVG